MRGARRFVVLPLVVLVACASARPEAEDHDNVIFPTSTTSTTTLVPSNVSITTQQSSTPPVESNETEEPKPVNERFPHAVLFGGTCGGSIISPTWILTAGHCTLFTGGRHVLAGTNNSEDGSGVVRYVKRLVIHPRFSVGPYWLDSYEYNFTQVAARWDFLLAELEVPLPLNNKTIVAVRLDDDLNLPAGLQVGYAGYGAEHHGETMRHEMHAMDLETIADSTCATLEQFDSHDMLCVKGRPPRYDSACNGDSGSGLVGSDKLIGVASWVQDDARICQAGKLVVFSRVARVRQWIKQVTGV